jgi:hypothetical protein
VAPSATAADTLGVLCTQGSDPGSCLIYRTPGPKRVDVVPVRVGRQLALSAGEDAIGVLAEDGASGASGNRCRAGGIRPQVGSASGQGFAYLATDLGVKLLGFGVAIGPAVSMSRLVCGASPEGEPSSAYPRNG